MARKFIIQHERRNLHVEHTNSVCSGTRTNYYSIRANSLFVIVVIYISFHAVRLVLDHAIRCLWKSERTFLATVKMLLLKR